MMTLRNRAGVVVVGVLVAALAGIAMVGRATDDRVDARRTTFVIVRHAEAMNDGTRDPVLSDAGRERAGRLAAMLGAMDVVCVNATRYQRTTQTAAAVGEAFGIPVEHYDPGDPAGLIETLTRAHAGGVVLIAGHSNTVPALVRALGADPLLDEGADTIPHGDHGRVYLVTPVEGAEPVCHVLRY